MKKRIRAILIVTAAFVLGVAVGQFVARRNVVTYAVPVPNGEIRNAVHMDWPTYGLPMAEYRMFLMGLDHGDTNRLRQRIDTCLDMALFDASFRRPALPDRERAEVDKAIAAVAKYRIDHPRSNTMPTREEVGERWWRDDHPYWCNQYNTVDALLEEVGTGDEITTGASKK
ncbi:MAG: hypothetical protein PHR35_16035 [Kiritimatiellae bacterium]|nr:hypothetical protein [Kiritimatiellia bacterium]